MPNKIPVLRATFEQLHDAIVDKFIEENKVKPSQEHLYGFNNFDETAPSIRKFMLDKHKEKYGVGFYDKDFSRGFGGKRLLEYYRKPKYNRNGQQLIDVAYLKMYLLYLGFENIEEFEKGFDILENEGVSQDEIVKYTGYEYNHTFGIKSYEIEINFSKNEAIIEKSSTNTRYKGEIQNLAVNTSIVLESQSTSANEKRTLHIILYRGAVSLKYREYALGVFSNISNRGFPLCGLIVLRKNDTVDKETPKEVEDIITKYLEGMQIRMDATSVIYPNELREVVERKSPNWETNKILLKNLVGDYYKYSLWHKDDILLRRVLRIKEDGSILYKGTNGMKYRGVISFINRRNALMYRTSIDGLSTYFVILRLSYEHELEYMEGKYVGINNENKPTFGKISLVKLKDGKYDTENTISIKKDSDIYNRLITEYPIFEKYFFDSKKNISELFSSIFTNSVDVSRYEGYYAMYYLSANKNKNSIKKNAIYISRNGNVRVILKYNAELRGKLIIEDKILYITLADSNTSNFFGLMTTYSRGYAGTNSMIGTLSMTNIDRSPIVRKIVLIKDNSIENDFKPKNILVGEKEFDYINKKYNGLGDLLQGQIDNYIRMPKFSNFTNYFRSHNYEFHFFNSAILNATQTQYKEAIEAFDLAIRHGYNDMERINNEIESGVFQPIKSEIKEVLKLINQ